MMFRFVFLVLAGFAVARRQFERHLRRCLKQGMDSAGVPRPNTGYDIWMHEGAAA
jgi:hypothetical protein